MFKPLAAALLALSAVGVSATTLYSNDFSTNTPLSGAGAIAYTFAGNYWATDAASSLSFSVGAGQQSTGTTLSLLFSAIDSWDNNQVGYGPDTFEIKLDNTVVFSAVFDNYLNQGPTTGTGITNLFYGGNIGGSYHNDAVYALSVNLGTLSAGTHTLSFAPVGPGWQGGSDESVGLARIQVAGTVAAVPEAGSLALAFAGGLTTLALARRRRAD